jgi:hypothetical protein
MKGHNSETFGDGVNIREKYVFTGDDKKILNYIMAKALLAAQVRKGLLAQESFDRMAEKIDIFIAQIDTK